MDRVNARLRVLVLAGFDEGLADRVINSDLVWLGETVIHSFLNQIKHDPTLMVVTDSTWQVNYMQDKLGLSIGPVIGGVNLEQFRPVPDTRSKKSPLRVLASGDPRPRKCLSVIEEAMEHVQCILPDVEFKTYWRLNLPQSEMASWLCSGDVFVDAQERAGWNNPVAEAFACGTPVVCTDIGAVRDFAVSEKNALLVPVRDSKRLAVAILRLLLTPKLRAIFRERGLDRIREFSWDIIAPKFESALLARLENISEELQA
jgi:glycosyltransferase involved in cell wall biosynthesis